MGIWSKIRGGTPSKAPQVDVFVALGWDPHSAEVPAFFPQPQNYGVADLWRLVVLGCALALNGYARPGASLGGRTTHAALPISQFSVRSPTPSVFYIRHLHTPVFLPPTKKGLFADIYLCIRKRYAVF